MEDQAETVLFHLCRGTDLRGAGGMLPVNGNLIRPLLMENRASIEEYLTGQGLSWRVDETNEDTSYTRNYLRREIMPRLSAGVNTASARHLARFADYCAEADRYLEKAAEEALPDLFYSLAERVGRHFDGNVAVRRDAKGGGTITIRFNNDNQVQEFLDDLNR